MKEIVVISGKGGTGKTSIVGSFAALAQPAVLADCDVDAADLHLILNPEIKTSIPFSGGSIAQIDQNQCSVCELCAQVCRFDALVKKKLGRYSVNTMACEGCGVCAYVCPTAAIQMVPHVNGQLFLSGTKYGPMVHAKLGAAEENSGKLVSLVRSHAQKLAEAQGLDLIIVDGSPGTGCPVMSSITGTDAVLIVTEPTVSGIHDLIRVAELTNHFKIPTWFCINKNDINPENTRQLIDLGIKLGVELLGQIRFDKIVTQAQIAAQPVVEFTDTDVASEITAVWQALLKKVNSNS